MSTLFEVLKDVSPDFNALSDADKIAVIGKLSSDPSLAYQALSDLSPDFRSLKKQEQIEVLKQILPNPLSYSNAQDPADWYRKIDKIIVENPTIQKDFLPRDKQGKTVAFNPDFLPRGKDGTTLAITLSDLKKAQTQQRNLPNNNISDNVIQSYAEKTGLPYYSEIAPSVKQDTSKTPFVDATAKDLVDALTPESALGLAKGIGKGVADFATGIGMTGLEGLAKVGLMKATDEDFERARKLQEETFAPKNTAEAVGSFIGGSLPYLVGGFAAGVSKARGVWGLLDNLARNVATGTGLTFLKEGSGYTWQEAKKDLGIDLLATGVGQVVSKAFENAKSLADRQAASDLLKRIRAIEESENSKDFSKSVNDLLETYDKIDKSKSVSAMFKQEIKALPEGIADNLPIKSSAIPMPEDVSALNKVLVPDDVKVRMLDEGKGIIEGAIPIHPDQPLPEGKWQTWYRLDEFEKPYPDNLDRFNTDIKSVSEEKDLFSILQQSHPDVIRKAQIPLEDKVDIFFERVYNDDKEMARLLIGEAYGEKGGLIYDENKMRIVGGFKSTYPDWFKNEKVSGKEARNIFQKILDGEELTTRQREIFDRFKNKWAKSYWKGDYHKYLGDPQPTKTLSDIIEEQKILNDERMSFDATEQLDDSFDPNMLDREQVSHPLLTNNLKTDTSTITPDQIASIEAKYGRETIEQVLRNSGFSGNISDLTREQAENILRSEGIDTRAGGIFVQADKTNNQGLSKNNLTGFSNFGLLKHLASAGVGAVGGGAIGETPEERIKNALMGGALGLGFTGGFELVDNVLSKLTTRIPKFRRLTDPLHGVSEQTSEKIVDSIYGIRNPLLAQGGIKTQSAESLTKQFLSKAKQEQKEINQFIIRYLENPHFRNLVLQKDPELAQSLGTIQKMIDDGSQELFERGYITLEQREKWRDRYLTRIYKQDESLDGVQWTKNFKQQEVFAGRKIESIMDIPEEYREGLGYIADPVLAIKATIAKVEQIKALDTWYRELVQMPDIMRAGANVALVELPQEVLSQYPKLPQKMSPYFAKEKILPYLESLARQGKIDGAIVQNFKQQTEKGISILEMLNKSEDKRFVVIGRDNKFNKVDMKFGVMAGLPIERTVANMIGGIVRHSNPTGSFGEVLEKSMSLLVTNFKMMNVPLNFQSYPRNYFSNFFQWGISGASPSEFFPETLRAMKSYVTKDEFYHKMLEHGLLDKNYVSEEIRQVINAALEGTKETNFVRKYFDILGKIGQYYGVVDDMVKMARVRYEMNRGRSISDAIKIAQQAHYDYSLVPQTIADARHWNTGMAGGGALKLMASPFLTYGYKTTGLLIDAIRNRPATAAVMMSAPIMAKLMIESYNKQKYKDKYDEIKRMTPPYLRGANIVPIMVDGKPYWIDLLYIVPWGEMLAGVDAGIKEIAKEQPISDKVSGAVWDVAAGVGNTFGIGQSPLGALYDIGVNKQGFNKRPIYNELDSNLEKGGKTLGYLADTFLIPGAVKKVANWMHTKHPILPRLGGFNVYTYSMGELDRIMESEMHKINKEASIAHAQVERDFKIHRDQQKRELAHKEIELRKERLIRELLSGN